MWVKFGQWKWKSSVVDLAQKWHMGTPQCYNLSLEEVLHKYYGLYKWPV
jgi:hypothetical protein